MFSALSMMELKLHFNYGDLHRLEEFVRHQCEVPFITDILPVLGCLYFLRKLKDLKLKPVKAVSHIKPLIEFSSQCNILLVSRTVLSFWTKLTGEHFVKMWNVQCEVIHIIPLPQAILCGVGVQHKTPETVAAELGVAHSIVMSQMHSLITDLTKQMVSNMLFLIFSSLLFI